MTGLFTGSSGKKAKRREARTEADRVAQGSKLYTGITPPNASQPPSIGGRGVLGGIKSPLSP